MAARGADWLPLQQDPCCISGPTGVIYEPDVSSQHRKNGVVA